MLHLCSFSPLCVFKCVLKLVASAYLHCHIGCICLTFLLKLSAREEAKSHWLHSFNFSTVCYQTSPKMLCRSGCIITRVTFVWLFFTVCFQISPQISCLIGYKITLSAFVWLPHCVLSNESSNGLPKRIHCHIGCICLTFLHCAFSNVSWNRMNYFVLQNIVIEYTRIVPSIHPGPISSTNTTQKE